MLKSNIDQFIRETKKEVEKELQKQESEGKKIILEALRSINRLSPVDTSFFRANNFVTFNGTTNRTLGAKESNERGFYSGVASENLNANIGLIVGKNLFNVSSVVIQNNLRYAEPLEAGRSRQAPQGVYGITEERIKRLLNRKL